jgi:putative transposase
MKTSRYIEAQILAILRQAEGGVPVAKLCRAHGISDASFYKWRAKYGGMDALMVSQMNALDRTIGAPLVQTPWRGHAARAAIQRLMDYVGFFLRIA